MSRFQERAIAWVLECFGTKTADDKVERADRFFEEATEMVQAGGMSKERALMLLDYVYDRPVGELRQEVGGVMTTLAAFCNAHRLDMEQCGNTELARCWTKTEQIREKQRTKPRGPLPQKVEPKHKDTIYTVGFNQNGDKTYMGTRSSHDIGTDTHVMYGCLELEQANRLRGVVIPPHQVGKLWVTSIDPRPLINSVKTMLDNGIPFSQYAGRVGDALLPFIR